MDKKTWVIKEEAQARYDKCKACEQFNSETFKCKLCGCYMKWNVKVALMECPIGKWGPLP